MYFEKNEVVDLLAVKYRTGRDAQFFKVTIIPKSIWMKNPPNSTYSNIFIRILVFMNSEAAINNFPSSPQSNNRFMVRCTNKNKARNKPKAPMIIFFVIEE
jgi:hypothetical protein